MRNHLKNHEFIRRVIQKAMVLNHQENYKYVIKRREKKSWPDLLALPGQKHFRIAKGIGDKTKVKSLFKHWRRESRKNITSAYFGAEESSDSDNEMTHTHNEEDHHTHGHGHHSHGHSQYH